MSDSVRQIEHLMYRYCELVDAGDFDGLARLFDSADHISSSGHAERGADAVRAYYERRTRRFPETGTPRTKHLTSNVRIEADESSGRATARSYFTVLQAVPGALALQPIVAGRYEDQFERVNGQWRFRERRKFVDLEGDLSEHLMWSPST
jgi:3-phenylpropionate/cinnamic acid dioxygenase small subunit